MDCVNQYFSEKYLQFVFCFDAYTARLKLCALSWVGVLYGYMQAIENHLIGHKDELSNIKEPM